jgi:integrase
MGLGGFPDVPLAQAKERARVARDAVFQGLDPIAERHAALSRLRAASVNDKTFTEAAEAYVEAHGESWKNEKHRAQWKSTLETYAYPEIGKLMVRDVQQEHVLRILEPIWKTKTETASRLRGRIESVLDWATVRKYRTGDNPARWKGHLDKLLAAPSKIQKVEHHRALPVDGMPAFMVKLRAREEISARTLEFAILCASRSGEVRGATWGEIDLETKVWTVPAQRMKGKREHRVPLCSDAVDLLRKLPRFKDVDWLFPAPRGGQLSDMTLTALMRRMEVDAVPHGFRSTFRDWAGERTNYPREVAEQALAHAMESKVEAAYRRGDALEKRRAMMQDWGKFLLGERKVTRSMADFLKPSSV